jgi:hypothetical protein
MQVLKNASVIPGGGSVPALTVPADGQCAIIAVPTAGAVERDCGVPLLRRTETI